MPDSEKDAVAVSSSESNYYSVDEALVVLGLFGKNGDRTLRRWRRSGLIKELATGPGGRVRLDKQSVDAVATESKRPKAASIEPSTDVVWVSREQLMATVALAEKMNMCLVALEAAGRREQQLAEVTAQRDMFAATIAAYEAKRAGLLSKIFRRWL